jgi:glycine/D-amino acid oxidase-like deaminating enzyme
MRALIDRREAATENIRFVFGTFSLGTVMVAASGKGIAAILMGDDREVLRRELKGAFRTRVSPRTRRRSRARWRRS